MTSNKKVFNITKANVELINNYIEYHTSIKPNLRPKSIYNIKETLKKLADHLKQKLLKDATEQDLMQFFKQIKYPTSRQSYAVHIIPFYRWIHHTPKSNRPPNMIWFEYPTSQEKRRIKNPNLKEELIITDEEYQQMIKYSSDIYGQNKAIWEIYYLTGIRPSELTSIKIKDVKNKDGITLITVPDSKSEPRTIPFPEPPYRLLEYLEQHPEKNNPESPLIFSLKSTNKIKHLNDEQPIRRRFTKIKKDLDLKSTLLLKSFRKTRTSIVFNQNKLTDKDIGKIFGWKPNTVIQRREEYELSNIDDLIKKYCSKEIHSMPSYTQLKEQHKTTDKKTIQKQEQLEKDNKNLKLEIKEIKATINQFSNIIAEYSNPTQEELSHPTPLAHTTEIFITPNTKQIHYWNTETHKYQPFGKPFEIDKHGYHKEQDTERYYQTIVELQKYLKSKQKQ